VYSATGLAACSLTLCSVFVRRGEGDYPLSVIRYPLSVIRYPLSVIRYPLSVIRYPLSVIRYPLSVIRTVISAFVACVFYFSCCYSAYSIEYKVIRVVTGSGVQKYPDMSNGSPHQTAWTPGYDVNTVADGLAHTVIYIALELPKNAVINWFLVSGSDTDETVDIEVRLERSYYTN
jgi:hypothetical protein